MGANNIASVLITDCSKAYRTRLAEELELTGSIKTMLAAEENEVCHAVQVFPLDVVIFDPYAISERCDYFIEKLLQLSPKLKVIVISFYDNKELINQCVRSGAKGFLNKTIDVKDLLDSILKVCTGEKVILSKQAACVR